jgi:cytochrome P450
MQAKAAAEVAQVLKGSTPTAANSRQLPYVEAVVLEALRLHAPAYMVGRCACRPTTLNGYDVDKGTTVLVR